MADLLSTPYAEVRLRGFEPGTLFLAYFVTEGADADKHYVQVFRTGDGARVFSAKARHYRRLAPGEAVMMRVPDVG